MAEVIAVTGGAGFIGSHLVKKLIEQDKKVIVVDGLLSGADNLLFLGIGRSDFELRRTDLSNFSEVKKALEGADAVFHMAARVGGISHLHGAENIELLSMQTNLTLDANVFRACQELGVKKIVYPSSVSVYPMEKQKQLGAVFSEDDFIIKILDSRFQILDSTLDPDGGYGLAKVLGEIELAMMKGIKIGIARIFSAYGENEPLGENSNVLSRFIRSAINYPKEQMVIWGDGSQTRDYVHVTDCAEALIKLLDKITEVGPLIVNVGAGKSVSISELASKVITVSGKDIQPVYKKGNPVGPVSRTADISRAKEILGWEPKVSLKEGLQRTYQWIEQKLS
jgi:nucleoside-diphosphate-sugar epimerase